VAQLGQTEPVNPFVKRCPSAPQGYAAWEAAGLAWLAQAEADGGARTVRVLEAGPDQIVLQRLTPAGTTTAQAEDFGRALAATHAAGAAGYGSAPPDWSGDGWLGPAHEPLPLPLRPTARWGEFYAEQRIWHTLRLGRDRGLWVGQEGTFERVIDRLAHGEFDGAGTDLTPARLHGDLWAGNILWTAEGGVLIDPAAHGGHRETDLAMLALFGAPHLGRILAAYDEAAPLTEGWRDRVGLHQLHPVMLHAVLFGGGYVVESLALARRYR